MEPSPVGGIVLKLTVTIVLETVTVVHPVLKLLPEAITGEAFPPMMVRIKAIATKNLILLIFALL